MKFRLQEVVCSIFGLWQVSDSPKVRVLSGLILVLPFFIFFPSTSSRNPRLNERKWRECQGQCRTASFQTKLLNLN